MIKTKYFLISIIFLILCFLAFAEAYYCSGRYPNQISDCTSLSTLAYNCCYLQGTSLTSSFLTYKVCYGFKAGKDPSEYPAPTLSPQINVNLMECGTTNSLIKKTDLCGIDSPQNVSMCSSYASNCCYLNYNGYTFCLDYNTFDWRGNGVELTCDANLFSNISFIVFLIYLTYF